MNIYMNIIKSTGSYDEYTPALFNFHKAITTQQQQLINKKPQLTPKISLDHTRMIDFIISLLD